MPDLYFNRVPSLTVTDDGSARPLTEDLSTGSGDGEDITWDADTAEAGEVPAVAGATSGTRPAGAEPRDGEAEFTEDDVAFLSASQEADAAPAIGESGRWFRPAKAKKKYVPIPPEDQADSAGLDVAPADPEPGGAVATQEPADPDDAEATQEPPEQAAGRATSTGVRVGSAAGRMNAVLRPGGAALASPPEGPVLAPSPEGPVLAPPPEGPVLAPGGRRLSRRRMLQAGLIGGAGVAALPLLTLVGGITRRDKPTAGLAFLMNTNWLFGGRYTSGSETSSYDDSNFAPVTVPHTVVPLSWKDWNYLAWQQVWI